MEIVNEVFDKLNLNEELGWVVAIIFLMAALPILKDVLIDVFFRLYELFLRFGAGK